MMHFVHKRCLLVALVGLAFTAKSYTQATTDDPTWNTGEAGQLAPGFYGTGGIYTASRHADGRMMVGGAFANYNGEATPRLVRLLPNGTRDNSFSIGTGFGGVWTAETGIPSLTTPLKIIILSDGSYLVGGNFRTYQGVTKGSLVKLLPNGEIDPDFNKDGVGAANGPVTSIMPVRDGKFVIAGSFTGYNGTSINRIARINADGTLDATFNTGGTNANAAVFDLDTLSNGNLIAVGSFTTFNGATNNRIVQLNQNGQPVPFASAIGAFNTNIRQVKVQQPGNKILVGGGFISYASTTRNRIMRFNEDGSVDNTFTPGTGVLDGQINSIAIDSEGRIILGGSFSQYNGSPAKRYARLLANGAIDASFNPNGYGPSSYTVAGSVEIALPIGTDRIFIAGIFREYELCVYQGALQVLPNGMPDPAFNPATGAAGGSAWPRPGVIAANDILSPRVLAIKTTSNGRCYVGGEFTKWGTVPRRFLARLNQDGSVDPTFLSNGFAAPNYTVWAIDEQPDGKLIIAGDFLTYAGVNRPNVARLNADGTLDESFFPLNAFNGRAESPRVVKVLPNGKILVGGFFNAFNLDNTKRKLVRLNSDGTLDNTFTPPLFNTNGNINQLFIQPDGKIIVAATSLTFAAYNNNGTNAGLFRLNEDGSFDPSFNNGAFTNMEAKGLNAAADGKIYVTGSSFNMFYGGQTRRGVFRINADGTVDNTFTGPQQTGTWDFIAAYDLPTGGIAAVGVHQALPQGSAFTINVNGIAVLNANGTANLSFLGTGHRLTGIGGAVNPNLLGAINAAAITPQGILVGGDFSRSNEQPRICMARMIPGNSTTPVTWQSFTAQPVANAVQLQWTTATEQNNKGFYVERSYGGTRFDAIAFVPAHGNGNSALPNTYTFTDTQPLGGTSYYRLRQTDLDGTTAFSAVRQVSMHTSLATTVVYPNPLPARFTLVPAYSGRLTVQFCNATGLSVGNLMLSGVQGSAMQVSRPSMPAGVYFIKVTYQNGSQQVIRTAIQ